MSASLPDRDRQVAQLPEVDGVTLWVLERGRTRRWQLRGAEVVLAETEPEDTATARAWITDLQAGRVPTQALTVPEGDWQLIESERTRRQAGLEFEPSTDVMPVLLNSEPMRARGSR